MEATQLSTISSNLVISKHHISLMGETVETVKEDLEKMKENVDRLTRYLQSLGALDTYKKELADTEAVAAWMAVDETESAISTLENMLEEVLPQRLEVAKSQREDASRAVRVLANRKKDADDFMQQFLERSAEISNQIVALKAAEKVAKIEMLKACRKVNTLREGLLNEQERKRDLQASITQMGEDVASEASTAAYLHQLSAAQAMVEGMGPGLAQKQEEYQATEAAHNNLVNQLDSLHQAERSTLSAVCEMEAEMNMVQAAGRNRIALFGGEPATRLRQAVDKAAKKGVFHRPPIGPLGIHLQLKDKGWALAIDSAVGSKMNNYLVHDGHDSRELIKILNSLNIYGFYRPDVCIQSFETPLHYIPENMQPNRSVLTIYRVLNCDAAVTPQVVNYLVDHENVEHKALALNRDQGRGLKGSCVKSVFFPDGEKLVFTKSSEIIMPCGPRAKPRVGGAQKDQIAHVKARMKVAQDTVNSIRAKIKSKEQELTEHNKVLTTARLDLASTKKSHFEAFRQVELLMSQPPVEYAATQAMLTAAAYGEGVLTQQQLALPGGIGGSGGGDQLESDILAVTQLIIDLGQQLKEAEDNHHEAQAKHAEADAGLKAAQEAIQVLSQEQSMKNNTVQEDAHALQEAQDRFDEGQKAVQELEKISNQRLRELADARQSLELLQEAAEQVSTRGAADEAANELKARLLEKFSEQEAARYLTVEVLSRKISKLQAKINDAEREMGGSTEDLKVQLQHAQMALDTDGRRKQGIIATYKMLRAALVRRERKLNELDQQLEAVINQRFNHYMRKKRHNGEIVLDREKQSLSLGVRITSEADNMGTVKDLKQLSGGERSFTTVAFTLALGGQTDMPFRAMDEFDVFMDAINRRMAMQSLFGFAREHDELQFVFLTPQDLSAVEAARLQCEKSKLAVPEDFVKVVQMRPARQNATVAWF
jgi:structural maintenance of chromosomes protein 6